MIEFEWVPTDDCVLLQAASGATSSTDSRERDIVISFLGLGGGRKSSQDGPRPQVSQAGGSRPADRLGQRKGRGGAGSVPRHERPTGYAPSQFAVSVVCWSVRSRSPNSRIDLMTDRQLRDVQTIVLFLAVLGLLAFSFLG
jgi:hypothetical protein